MDSFELMQQATSFLLSMRNKKGAPLTLTLVTHNAGKLDTW